ncbi:hypothetical protein DNFV4_03511 [Nitrospira tepida]|uniref:Nitrogen regulatory protein P-II n=1 Tax=Nitrospira tepida TaxID=2973512 RepID=A0AA86TE82_9BACT|nr:PG0541 family transporter-associated protein [Nitrospira tepida]CAI4033079.1 hypothetical protein DNFV4_03511 [Nitrospira tepida]
MQMLMIVFRSSLKERVDELLRDCDVRQFTEINEAVGQGQSGPAEGAQFYPGTNTIVLVALDDAHVEKVAQAVQAWCRQVEDHPGWQRPSIRVFAFPCTQIA